MATRKNIQTAAALGTIGADTLEAMLLEGKPLTQIADVAGCHVSHLVWAMGLPDPAPLPQSQPQEDFS